MRIGKIALSALLVMAGMVGGIQAPAQAASRTGAQQFFTARLSGANEVPAGDPDGSATALVRISGDQVTFAVAYRNIGAPTAGHIHQGRAGTNGPVRVGLFATPMPESVTAAAGSTMTDRAVADAIRANPSDYYVNLHTAAFPAGAVRGQLTPLGGLDLLSFLHLGGLRAFLSGDQEVGGGDPDARGLASVRLGGTTVNYALAWSGVAPTLGHIHRGRAGTNGPVVVLFFGTAVPSTVFAIAGTVTGVDAALVREIRGDPRGFYVNLHSAEFPGGAIRGQLMG